MREWNAGRVAVKSQLDAIMDPLGQVPCYRDLDPQWMGVD